MPYNLQPALEPYTGSFSSVIRHKDGFLYGHHNDGRSKHDKRESQFSFHFSKNLSQSLPIYSAKMGIKTTLQPKKSKQPF